MEYKLVCCQRQLRQCLGFVNKSALGIITDWKMLKDQSVEPNMTKVSTYQHGNWNRLENVMKGPNHWSQYMTQLSTNHHRGVGKF